ncbi:hypothetical protein [Geobacillus sp. C56-T2]|uniref:hypothetical protein n=1 Tax=Geobacillus sp. C56-T2 TaxID=600773 RepID=UPI0016487CA6|nr:hypothetical protein [Geobacillus sp. C56-T2]
MEDVYAHTPPENGDKWHRLDDHLLRVAEMAQSFAAPFQGQGIVKSLSSTLTVFP